MAIWWNHSLIYVFDFFSWDHMNYNYNEIFFQHFWWAWFFTWCIAPLDPGNVKGDRGLTLLWWANPHILHKMRRFEGIICWTFGELMRVSAIYDIWINQSNFTAVLQKKHGKCNAKYPKWHFFWLVSYYGFCPVIWCTMENSSTQTWFSGPHHL